MVGKIQLDMPNETRFKSVRKDRRTGEDEQGDWNTWHKDRKRDKNRQTGGWDTGVEGLEEWQKYRKNC